MKHGFLLTAALALISADVPEIGAIQQAEVVYAKAIQRADAEHSRTCALESQKRLIAYRSVLKTVTMAGDFDRAIALKARIDELESREQKAQERPMESVRFGGHAYSLIRKGCTWHTAKRRCEEMGGHLATANSPAEEKFLRKFVSSEVYVWVGASDEAVEGKWVWLDGTPLNLRNFHPSHVVSNHLLYNRPESRWFEGVAGSRLAYACEWDD